jgi:hypothetical protein
MPEVEPEDLPDILERINANLKAIHSELERQRRETPQTNLRLATLIVFLAVPVTFLVNFLSTVYMDYIFTIDGTTIQQTGTIEDSASGWTVFSVLLNLALLLLSTTFMMLIWYRYARPIFSAVVDSKETDKIIAEMGGEPFSFFGYSPWKTRKKEKK